MDSLAQYLRLFDQNRPLLLDGPQAVAAPLRLRAYEALQTHGLPTRKEEKYRYTDVQSCLALDYGLNLHRRPSGMEAHDVSRGRVAGVNGPLVLMANDEVLSVADVRCPMPAGVEVNSLGVVAAQSPRWLADHLAQLAVVEQDSMVALNTLLAQEGLVVRAHAGCCPGQPIQVVCQGASQMDLMTLRRLLVVVEEDAELSLLMVYRDAGEYRRLVSQVAEVYLEKNARLHLWLVEQGQAATQLFDHVVVRQAARSRLDCGCFSLQGGTTRRTLEVCQLGQEAVTQVYGGVIGLGREHVDNHLLIRHEAPNCQSDVLFKYVLDDESVGAFAGKVLVQRGAQKIQSQETNANLCVSPTARMFTQPMLEIYADDVKCNHGSTVGRLDERALFYMAQRGIPEPEARMLLQEAFLGEAVARVAHEPLRERLSYWVEERFRYKMGHCNGCDICDTERLLKEKKE